MERSAIPSHNHLLKKNAIKVPGDNFESVSQPFIQKLEARAKAKPSIGAHDVHPNKLLCLNIRKVVRNYMLLLFQVQYFCEVNSS